ncbi:GntR family transcriptional regulator [Rhodococcus sp. Eu-32]|uniref:GntR family transcriptional regulator n=1 Tax=Rhodococcus sp. Eu-32 TaxID=1017319 RepID=UPI001FB1B552|nr:GntR family transcriptional regulator [Rhodococcus sp. Eu-32]
MHSNADMAPMAVDRNDERPLHVQVRDRLHDEISSGRALPGSALPTEDELQRQFGVARSVVRQALGSLADLGLITRARGRGSIVAAPPALRRSIQRAGGLDEQASTHGQRLRTHVLSVDKTDAPDRARTALNTSRTTRLERIRYLEDVPVAYMTTWVPADLFPHFTAQLLEGNSLLGLMRAHGHTPSGGPRQVQAVSADATLAAHLNADVGDPLLLLEGVTQDENGVGLEWFRVWHRQNTVFDVDAHVVDPGSSLSAEKVQHLKRVVAELQSALSSLTASLEN